MNKTKYTPQPIDTTDVELPKELEQLVEEMSKMYMRYGLRLESNKVGSMVNGVTMSLRRILALCRTRIFLKRKRSMTAILPSVH